MEPDSEYPSKHYYGCIKTVDIGQQTMDFDFKLNQHVIYVDLALHTPPLSTLLVAATMW